MSNIRHFPGGAELRPAPRARGPYRKKVTAAEIERAVRVAEKLGLTIYGLTIEGDKVHVQTKPGPENGAGPASAADDWFSRRG
ncbi:hypothetical protein [Palleronia sp.]|uniref:hypothetical protein n=1 Tax=Palleronia sp. TaxID=1940284 RepID=UPI0035C83D76